MNDKVIIKDLELNICNGVNDDEKVNPQPFIFTIEIGLDFMSNASEDDINKTISYSKVKKLIVPYLESHVFNLLEKMAYEVCKLILINFPMADFVNIKIKKPKAPITGKFKYVGVKSTLSWHKVYLSLGSNMGDREHFLDLAIEELKNDDNFKDIIESKRINTKPYGGVAEGEFINSAVELKTMYNPHALLDRLHEIEALGERTRDIHWGNRTLDLDILFYDDLILSDKDLVIPHADLENRMFVLEPLMELNPNIVHPLYNKRVSTLYKNLQYLQGK